MARGDVYRSVPYVFFICSASSLLNIRTSKKDRYLDNTKHLYQSIVLYSMNFLRGCADGNTGQKSNEKTFQ
jgi:hypothetical protein